MLVDYVYWQFFLAPRWLLHVTWNLQRALVRLFSVPVMLRTLLAPWHRDTISFHGGTLSQFGLTILWNLLSRGIGLLVRSSALVLWLTIELVFLALVAILIPAFIAWPALVIVGVATGLALSTYVPL
ncbi:MAG TPA: hypothetical protein VJC05_00985 [Candidatus Andersenbacteria bacterium]|nr:hypothetical protein [Candidatus Andersenbacteria bacterium]